MAPNPLEQLFDARGFVVLDGGLATALEADGHVLDSALWSARLLLDVPEAIRAVHLAYLEAGADIITTGSYQASFEGFAAAGIDEQEAELLLRRSVDLAVGAREEFWSNRTDRAGRAAPLVAASAGPYGAFLADGSEYSGLYGVGQDVLRDFHQGRLRVLASTPADLVAFETIPARAEAEAIADVLAEVPSTWAWIAFSCRDEKCLWDGSRIADVARSLDGVTNLAGIGVNCTAPRHVTHLIAEIREQTEKPVIVYPNSGEAFDPERRAWIGASNDVEWLHGARAWVEAGARVIGGCCRVGPGTIRALRGEMETLAG